MSISLNTNLLDKHLTKEELFTLSSEVLDIHSLMASGLSQGSEMLGWLDYKMDDHILMEILNVAKNIRKKADILVVIGAGGSYCGAMAMINALSASSYATKPKVLFAGNSLSTLYIKDILAQCDSGEVYINVISKSGTTTEPAIAFRIFKEYMENRYGKEETAKRIIATTDPICGALREMSQKFGYKTFDVPRNIGGRYSVITPVGLFPIACVGIDITQLLNGYYDGINEYSSKELSENPAYQYAVLRYLLYKKGKVVEITSVFEPALEGLLEWHKQLFGESEGKDGKGIFPAQCCFTRDLHSIGQYIQQGSPILFETFIEVGDDAEDIYIPYCEEDLDGLNYMSNVSLGDINKCSAKGSAIAHYNGNVPVISITIPKLDPYNMGKLIYFFQISCAMSGYLLDVNPFDQPGVETYKKSTKELILNLTK